MCCRGCSAVLSQGLKPRGSKPPGSRLTFAARSSATHSRDHHLRRFDYRERVVAPPEFQRAHGVGGDHGGQGLVTDAEAHLGKQAVDPHFIDEPMEPVARAEADECFVGVNGRRHTTAVGLLTGEQPIHLGVGNPVMAALSVEYATPSRSAAALTVSWAMDSF
jgi:hypothetical protein